MEIVNIPRLSMISGQSFSQAWQVKDDDGGAVDLSEYSGAIAFSRNSIVILQAALTLTDQGFVRLDLDASDVSLLAGPQITFEINLTAPSAGLSQTWRGLVTVQ